MVKPGKEPPTPASPTRLATAPPTPPTPDEINIALKYLDLARAEILARIKSSNDTLIVYAGGIGAIVAWLYKASIDKGPNPNSIISSDLLSPAVLVICFLSFAATWIIFHNEKMVGALSRYQKELAPRLLGESVIQWESSKSLCDTDTRVMGSFWMLLYALLLATPSVIGCLELWQHRAEVPNFKRYFSVAIGMSVMSVILIGGLFVNRWRLRPTGKDGSEGQPKQGISQTPTIFEGDDGTYCE